MRGGAASGEYVADRREEGVLATHLARRVAQDRQPLILIDLARSDLPPMHRDDDDDERAPPFLRGGGSRAREGGWWIARHYGTRCGPQPVRRRVAFAAFPRARAIIASPSPPPNVATGAALDSEASTDARLTRMN